MPQATPIMVWLIFLLLGVWFSVYDIRIDFNEEILFGHEQMFNTYPVVFPTVTFALEPTDDLPEGGWIGICGLDGGRVENAITTEDGSVELSEEEQGEIWEELDRQCRERLGKGCEELLAEAREKME